MEAGPHPLVGLQAHIVSYSEHGSMYLCMWVNVTFCLFVIFTLGCSLQKFESRSSVAH